MAESTSISWCDHTWSPWYGCTQVSMGAQGACEGCYARFLSETRQKRVIFGGPGRGEGTRDVRADSAWREPPRWNRKTPGAFVFPSMCDPFDNHPALVEPRRRFFDLIRATPNLTWLLLTKRPGNIVKLFRETILDVGDADYPQCFWPSNAAIGCTVVSQAEANRDIPKLLAAKAALKPAFAFLSMEPLLGAVDLTRISYRPYHHTVVDALNGYALAAGGETKIDWVIAGGETDQGAHKARPSHPDWFRSLRDQCAAAEVPFHFKQWGSLLPWEPQNEGVCWKSATGIVRDRHALGDVDDPTSGWTDNCLYDGEDICVHQRVGSKAAGRHLDGVTHDARPEVRR